MLRWSAYCRNRQAGEAIQGVIHVIKNPYLDMIKDVLAGGLYTPGELKGKSALMIGGFVVPFGASEKQSASMELQAYFIQQQIRECICQQYIGQTSAAAAGQVPAALPNRQFDVITLLEGFEQVRSYSRLAASLRQHCLPGGSLLILVRTPLLTGTTLFLRSEEDRWRYECQDIESLFPGYIVEKEITTTPAYFAAVKLRKPLQEPREPAAAPMIYHTRLGRRASEAAAVKLGFFSAYSALDDLGLYELTDKCSQDHNYLDKYEFFLRQLRGEKFTLLELGVFEGGSERMWKAYFPQAQIVGVDINPECKKFAEERIDIRIADLGNPEVLEGLKALRPQVIIDDASHLWSHQILALMTLFPVLPSGGVYILEDMETSLNPELYPGFADAPMDAYDVCERIARVAAGKKPCCEGLLAEQITEIGMNTELVVTMKGSCIFIKR